jgi:hypothetical protein
MTMNLHTYKEQNNMSELFEQTHLDFISDVLAPMSDHPSHIVEMANKICDANPSMNREKFLARAVTAWEGAKLDQMQAEADDNLSMCQRNTSWSAM